MSEITRGAIGMPFEMAMSSELSRRQFHSIAQALLTESEAMAKRLLIIDIVHGPKAEMRWTSLAAERDQFKAENQALRKFIIGLAEADAQIAYAYADLVAEISHE